MIDLNMLPSWVQVDDVVFTRGELSRARPAWFWMPAHTRAWRTFRARLAVLNMLIDQEKINPSICWAECRLYLQSEDRNALDCAKELTRRSQDAPLVARLVQLRVGEGYVGRLFGA